MFLSSFPKFSKSLPNLYPEGERKLSYYICFALAGGTMVLVTLVLLVPARSRERAKDIDLPGTSNPVIRTLFFISDRTPVSVMEPASASNQNNEKLFIFVRLFQNNDP
ncbi:MAG: hypothetical protein K6G79_08995 [Bacteroidales bacterium]|nr:hypothetical protein [Bacteroidales bacterium]